MQISLDKSQKGSEDTGAVATDTLGGGAFSCSGELQRARREVNLFDKSRRNRIG